MVFTYLILLWLNDDEGRVAITIYQQDQALVARSAKCFSVFSCRIKRLPVYLFDYIATAYSSTGGRGIRRNICDNDSVNTGTEV